MDSMSKVAIVVGTKEIQKQIAEYTEIGTDRAPAIVYKKQGVFFKKQDVINLLKDVKEISVLGPEQSRDLGCLNRLLSVDRFLDSRGQSRLFSAWWGSIFK